jgi:hypothetical protein
LQALDGRGVRRAGKGWQARCAQHDDEHASLSLGEGDDGRALLHCHVGCRVEDVVAALGLTMADLMPANDEWRPNEKRERRSKATSARIVATYDYIDQSGELQYQLVRREPKGFSLRRPDGTGGWIPGLEGVGRVLYRLPELLAARWDEPTIVVEGEKDADALAKLGFIATTNMGGAGKWEPEYTATLARRHVVILPDNDDAGREHAERVARALVGVAASLKVVELPGLPESGDVSDWLMQGGTPADLLEFIRSTPFRSRDERIAGEDDGNDEPALNPAALAVAERAGARVAADDPDAPDGGQ